MASNSDDLNISRTGDVIVTDHLQACHAPTLGHPLLPSILLKALPSKTELSLTSARADLGNYPLLESFIYFNSKDTPEIWATIWNPVWSKAYVTPDWRIDQCGFAEAVGVSFKNVAKVNESAVAAQSP